MSAADRLDRAIAADRQARGIANGVTLDEATFQSQVVELAGMLGWQHLHVRRTRGRGGAWTTSTNLPGWPDLYCWHPQRGVFAAELKSEKGQLRPDQVEVLASLEAAGVETHVWRPSDFDEIRRRLQSSIIKVAWHPDAIQRAHDDLVEFRDGHQPSGVHCSQAIAVAIAALRACGADGGAAA